MGAASNRMYKLVPPTTKPKQKSKVKAIIATINSAASTTVKPSTSTTIKLTISTNNEIKTKKSSLFDSIITTPLTENPTTTTSIRDTNGLREKFCRDLLILSDELIGDARNYSNYFVKNFDYNELEPYEDEGRLQYIC
uniref:Uncharacterized protein n=1 Tax=Strongyloides venezuelensis TaxID=75913 RepID=A0A0K0FHS1_STRVS